MSPIFPIRRLTLDQVKALVETGALTLETLKDVVLKLVGMLQAIADFQKTFSEDSVPPMPAELFKDLRDEPVTEETLNQWQPGPLLVDFKEIEERQAAMSRCIAKENWFEGFVFGLQIMATIGSGGAA